MQVSQSSMSALASHVGGARAQLHFTNSQPQKSSLQVIFQERSGCKFEKQPTPAPMFCRNVRLPLSWIKRKLFPPLP